MGSVDRFPQLAQALEQTESVEAITEPQPLTPRLCVVVAILYMMAVDSDISEYESSQLQAVVGTDSDTLKRAIAYSERNSVEQFLKDAPPLLDARVRLCLLVNVCDSLMADGVMVAAEEQLFGRMLAAMGHTKVSFQPYFDTITIKDKTSIFGDFDAAANSPTLTPPLALVVSLIYMMAADGTMAEEEVGRLNAAVGGSPALLKAGLRYVSKVRAPQFLALAAPMLDEHQRLCILLNACDTMMSDRQVVKVERELFRRMLTAFEVAEKDFERHLNIIFLKNDVPDETIRSPIAAKKSDIPSLRASTQEEGVVFQRKKEWEEETGEAGKNKDQISRADAGAAKTTSQPSEMETRISNTMRQNTDRLSQELEGDTALESLEKNSRTQALAANEASNVDGESDLRTVRDADASISSNKAAGNGDGPADTRALRDTDADTRSAKAKSNNAGPADQRAVRDANAELNSDKALSNNGGPADQRTVRDADAELNSDKALSNNGGPADQRTVRDADAELNSDKALSNNDGPADPRSLRDSAAAKITDTAVAAADGPAEIRALKDASGITDSSLPPGLSAGFSQRLRDAKKPAERRELNDANGLPANRQMSDARRAFDSIADDASTGPIQIGDLDKRMEATRDRTYKIFDYVEAIRSAKSIASVSRLPLLPLLPVTRPAPLSAHGISFDSTPTTRATWDDGSRTLLASDKGGPIMSEPQGKAPSSGEEAKLNRQLRYTSAVLLPALFLTYGVTMVGESVTQHGFVVNENIATDARIVHQMASVQQTVYRIAPESVILSVDKFHPGIVQAASTGGSAGVVAAASTGISIGGSKPGLEDKELSDRTKADNFLEQRKQELMAVAQSHQGASAVAAERQQWFIYAKSIVLLGLGMAFWGVLFRSMKMLHVSTAIGVLSLLLTANGYWLFVQL